MSRARRPAPRQLPAGVRPLKPAQLRWRCPLSQVRAGLKADAADAAAEAARLEEEVPDPAERERIAARLRLHDRPSLLLAEVFGQERALAAIGQGLTTEAPGFHVFVCGPRGSGRVSLVKAALEQHRPPMPRPRDRVYVADFQHPERPRLLTLPRGKGRHFRRDLDDMLAVLRRAIPAALGQERHIARLERIRRRYELEAARPIEVLAAELRLRGLIVTAIPEGYGTPELRIEVGPGEPLPLALVERRIANGELSPDRELRRRIAEHPQAMARLEQAALEARAVSRQGTLALRRVEAEAARAVAQGFADDMARAYPTDPVRRWLRSLLEAIGDRLELFIEQGRRDEEGGDGGDGRRPQDQDPLACFRANLFVDARERPVPPVIYEPNPTYSNLFGACEATELAADHLRLRAGSLMQANGGVLVVDAAELFHDLTTWRALKRAVRSGWLEVPSATPGTPGSAMRPEPIRSSFKLVAIGSDEIYQALLDYDDDFAEVFKVKVQLEEEVPTSARSVQDLARALARVARRAGLAAPDAGALARLLEHSARLSGRSDRLSPRFAELIDVLQEADRNARARGGRGAAKVKVEDVEVALSARRARHDLPERRVQEDLIERQLLVETRGSRVGVINALVVYDTGDHVFSRPSRVTATVGLGRQGLVDIEREVHLSGRVHHKGVQIVSGLLRERFAQNRPLCLTASICFEQSYDIVDGDSASVAEVLAVLSALGELPLSQSLAVTGSLNQKGEVQPVGGLTEKVEGYFAACRVRGLDGTQGVVIPAVSARDLMLAEEVVQAVTEGKFQVIPVETLDQALELFTGVPAGARPAPGEPWPAGTCQARIDARLEALALAARRWAGRSEPGGQSKRRSDND